MKNWMNDYLAQTRIQPLLADIKAGRIAPVVVMNAIQQLTDDEKRKMKPAIDLVVDALRNIPHESN